MKFLENPEVYGGTFPIPLKMNYVLRMVRELAGDLLR